eukprot:g15346.t1
MEGTSFGVHYREAMEFLTQHLVTKPGLRSVWTLHEKRSAFTEIENLDHFDSHEVPALDPIRLGVQLSNEEVEEGDMVET